MYRNYIRFEWKRLNKMAPRLLKGACISLLAVIMLAVVCIRMVDQKETVPRMKVAVSIENQENNLAALAMNLVRSVESVNNVCEFQEMNLEQGYELLDQGEVTAIIHIPDEFVEGVMDGRNIPAQIIYRGANGMSVSFFKLLTQSAAMDLSAAQAGIYTLEDFSGSRGLPQEQREQFIDAVNEVYFDYVLPREDYFTTQYSSVTGQLSTTAYYILDGMIFFLFLAGSGFSALFLGESRGFRLQLIRNGIHRGRQTLAQFLSVWGAYLIVLLAGLALSWFPLRNTGMGGGLYGVPGLAAVVVTSFCVSAFLTMIFTVFYHETIGILVLVLSTLLMEFLSGGCIPAGFLSTDLIQAGKAFPVLHVWKLWEHLLAEGSTGGELLPVLLFGMFFLVIAGVGIQIKKSRGVEL